MARPGSGDGFDPSAPLEPSRALTPMAVRINTEVVRRGFWPKLRKLARHVPFAQDAAALWFAAVLAASIAWAPLEPATS